MKMPIRWSRLRVPLCMFNRHSPVRELARWDGENYVGNCHYCGKSIVRRNRGVWKINAARTDGLS